LEAVAIPDLYEHLKVFALETQVLANFEKLKLLVKTEPLVARKPSQWLVVMHQFCPPPPSWAMLCDVEHGDLQTMAAKGDRLFSLNPVQANIAATVKLEEAENPMAAVLCLEVGSNTSATNSNACRWFRFPLGNVSTESAGLCFYHSKFGDNTTKCWPSYSWQGN
jgi:hypothetical protein